MYNNQEAAAFNRVLHLLEENSIAYLAEQNMKFRGVVERLYRDVNKELAA